MINSAVAEKHELQIFLKQKFSFLFKRDSLFYYVLLLIGVGFCFFAYALFTQKFTTPFSGDYSQQAFAFYYNFYDDWWTFFNTGKFPFYDANTFIGADNILANTYYALFSPFTFPILMFPRQAVPQAMALCTIAKMVTGGLLFRIYLKYMGCTEKTARIFSFAYAFTGWMAYYLWFNNFYEVLAFFPLILLGIEKVIKERKIWAVSLGFFLIGLGNYFFLLTMGIFGVVYGLFRFFQTIKERTASENFSVIGIGFVGFALGYLMCGAVVFPAVISSFGINRAQTSKYWPTLQEAIKSGDFEKTFKIIFTYWHPNIVNYGYEPSTYYFSYAFPLASYFYPTVSCRYVNIIHYTEFENSGSSIFYFTPLIIMFCACFYKSLKNKKVSHIIALLLILMCLFVPFFYFLSGAFSNNYGRWEIIVPAIGITYIALNFDKREEISKTTIFISGIIAFVMMLGTFFLAKFIISQYGYTEGKTSAYIDNFGDATGIIIYELVLCAVEVFVLGQFWNHKKLPNIVQFFIIGEAIVMGTVTANMHFLQNVDTDVNGGFANLFNETAIIENINNTDNSFFRLQSPTVDESHPNLPNAENYNGISTFHTFYNNEVDDFVHMMQITCHDTSWSGLFYGKHANLDEFLGVKYYLTKDQHTSYYSTDESGKTTTYTFPANVALNYKYQESLSGNGFKVYKNERQINFGISYDKLFYKRVDETNPTYNAFYKGAFNYSNYLRNEEAVFDGVILNDDDVEQIKQDYKDTFNIVDGAPSLKASNLSIKSSFYHIEKEDEYFDPFNTNKWIKDQYKVSADQIDEKTMDVKKFLIVYEPYFGEFFPIGEKGGYYMLDYPTRLTWGSDYSAAVFLIDKDNNVISFDDFGSTRNSNYTGHMIRGLYSTTPIKQMIIVSLGSSIYKPIPNIYYEPWENVDARFQKAQEESLQNVKFSVNDFTFETNYEKEKFVVTQVAYVPGWNVYALEENGVKTKLKTYNAQGGFLGFIAPKGHVFYEMSYMTKNFPELFAISITSSLAVIAISVVPIIVRKKKQTVVN